MSSDVVRRLFLAPPPLHVLQGQLLMARVTEALQSIAAGFSSDPGASDKVARITDLMPWLETPKQRRERLDSEAVSRRAVFAQRVASGAFGDKGRGR